MFIKQFYLQFIAANTNNSQMANVYCPWQAEELHTFQRIPSESTDFTANCGEEFSDPTLALFERGLVFSLSL